MLYKSKLDSSKLTMTAFSFLLYTMLCEDLEVDSRINDIDILEKAEEEFVVLNEQYEKKSTELFERHHKK